MMHTRKILASAALAATLFAGNAFAVVPVTFVDDDINYNETDTMTAYLSLSMEDGALAVTLDDISAGSNLPAIAFDIPTVDRHDILGNDLGAELASIDEISVETTGNTLTSIEVTHLEVSLTELAEMYQSQLASLGFDVDVTYHTNNNFATIEASNDSGNLRVVMHRTSGGVDTHLFRL